MTERGMIFSAPMVRALLDGRKTQTRRPVKVPEKSQKMRSMHGGVWLPNSAGEDVWINSPYGVHGDRIWVRETLTAKDEFMVYAADFGRIDCGDMDWPSCTEKRKTIPSIHLPRLYSRITLEITEVRVERVQEISHEDAVAEGVALIEGAPLRNQRLTVPQHIFAHLWDSIYGSWDANPWVWVYGFKRIH